LLLQLNFFLRKRAHCFSGLLLLLWDLLLPMFIVIFMFWILYFILSWWRKN